MRRVMKQGSFFICTVRCCQAFKRIPEHIVTACHHIRRKDRIEHAARNPEVFDCMFIVAPRFLHEFLACRRAVPQMPAKAVHFKIKSTQFSNNIRAGCELCDQLFPMGENLILLSCIRPLSQWSAKMVQNDGRVRKSPSEINYLV